MNARVAEVKDKRLLKKFIKFPYKLYENSPYYVPHLFLERLLFFNPKLNPFFKHAKVRHFLAIENGDVLGRISAIVNTAHNKFHNDKVGFFGNFDVVNNMEVARLLVKKAEDFVKSEGMEILRGPVNFSTNDECGLLVKGFDSPPKIMMTYNYQYYANLLESIGFNKSKDLYAFMLDRDKFNMEKLRRASTLLKKRYNVSIRPINFKKFKSELKILYYIYNKAWEKNWGFVPMNEEEFYHSSSMLKYVADRELILIASVNNEPVGFIVALPDINEILKDMNGKLLPFGIFKFLLKKKHIKTLRIITLGVVDKYRNKGLDFVLITDVVEKAFEKGIRFGECSWILEDNKKMNNALLKLSGEVYKIYRIYDKKV